MMRQHNTPKKARPRCGAKTRKGTPCRAPVVWNKRADKPRNGRCRMHGGSSTGPTSDKGKERIAQAQRRRWARYRAAKYVDQVEPDHYPPGCTVLVKVGEQGGELADALIPVTPSEAERLELKGAVEIVERGIDPEVFA